MGVGSAVGPLAVGAISEWRSVDDAAISVSLVSAIGALWYVCHPLETLPPGEGPVRHLL